MPVEDWPTELPCRPVVGDIIESNCDWGEGRRLYLKVVSVRFKHISNLGYKMGWEDDNWKCEVELHIVQPGMSIYDFENWYRRLQGKNH